MNNDRGAEEGERRLRKHPAHGVLHIDGQPTIIFGTVCTRDRLRWLDRAEVHGLLEEVWRQASKWLVGRYVVMPDHIHFFCAATETNVPYDNWVRYWKSQFSKRYRNAAHRWQTDHWDMRMRSERQYEEKWEYVRWNPVRHKLVQQPEQWLYQGELHPLRWS